MNDKIAIVVNNANVKVNVYETIDAIKEAGFKNVFIQWYNRNWNISQEKQLKYIKNKGLNIIFAHLSYDMIDYIWLDNPLGDKILNNYMKDIKICHDNGIYFVIMHLNKNFKSPKYNKLGLKRIEKLANYAKELNVKIAFENVELKGYLEYIIDNINLDNIGICFDSGHYHTFYKDDFDLQKFKNKIFAVHLHDNFQNGDLHLIPFDGNNNWNEIIKKLNDANYKGYITMEQRYSDKYLSMDILSFYKKSIEIGKKLYLMSTNNKINIQKK